ncbi:MAG: N-acetylneuraminate synthase family protein [Elusimicrobiota bacterium]|jgi:N-acetylneuraminate synthase|nr:N-acetylneuraminate synthase family protein [Elusimicrobiota bacterium]
MKNNIFEELFVLELANNHWGGLQRGLEIIDAFAKIVRFNNIRAAIKLQIRDVENFIHKDFRNRKDIRYIAKTMATQMSLDDYAALVKAIRNASCITMATPFDEKSVDICDKLGIEIFKIASSDINDWVLIERIVRTRKPVIVSTGGSSLKDIDDLVTFFDRREIPLAINHCVSIYPSEKNDLEMNQIDFLKNRYPGHTVGFSTHETNDDIEIAMIIAVAKGVKIFERHIDIITADKEISPYCSSPKDLDRWIKAYKKALLFCGHSGLEKARPKNKEITYLDALVRGVYARKELKKGHKITDDDVYLAIPLQKRQISCRELMRGETLLNDIKKDDPLTINDIDSAYADNDELKKLICERGL